MLTINPNNLDRTTQAKLFQFFSLSSDDYWKKNTTYSFANGTQFTFANDVIKRARKETHAGFRYEFIGNNELGKGSYGVVFPIDGTLALNNKTKDITFKQFGYRTGDKLKRRVVKKQLHDADGNPKDNATKEYDLSLQASHLGIKKPVFVGDTSYTVMKFMPGEELFDVLVDSNRLKALTTIERLRLTLSLLNALKTQVTDKGLIHRDIKPENIRVDMSTFTVNIIDYGLSVKANMLDNIACGTLGYVAPEVIDKSNPTNSKADVFSMAKVIGLLWEADFDEYYDIYYTAKKLNEFTIKDAHQFVQPLLKNMLAVDPDDRLSLENAINLFNKMSTNNQSHVDRHQVINTSLMSLNKLKNHSKTIGDDSEKTKEILALVDYLSEKLQQLNTMDDNTFKDNIIPYTIKCQEKIDKVKPCLEEHRNAKYILTNIGLAIIGLGIFYGIAASINKSKTGNFMFFTSTKSSRITHDVATDFDKLLEPVLSY
jgi:serine/threonine-protein kinase LegK1